MWSKYKISKTMKKKILKNLAVRLLLIIFLFLNLGCKDIIQEYDGVWNVTHFKIEDKYVLDNEFNILPKDVPSHKRILFFINSSYGKAGFNYTRDKTTNSDFEYLNDSTIVVTSKKDQFFYGEYHVKYENKYLDEGSDKWITREETLELTSNHSTIKMIRGELINRENKDILGK